MITGVVCFIVANVAIVFAARAMLRHVRTGRAEIDALVVLLIRLLLISLVVLVAGVTWLIRPVGLLVLSLGTAGTAYALGRAAVPQVGEPVGKVRPGLLRYGIPLALAATFVAVKLLAQVWILAPYAGDALSYHLPKIAEWVRAGHFTVEMGPDTHANFPAGFELIETWWVAFFHHDVLIEMGGVELLVVAFASAYALARHVALSGRWSFFAALAFVMVPGLNLQATSCLNDLPMVALFVASAALIVCDAPTGLLLLPIGLGAGVKGTFLYALPGLAALWLLERRARLARTATGRPVGAPAARRAAATFAMRLAIAALLAGGFWYARNAVWFGNPLYPMGAEGVKESNGYVTIRFGVSVPGWFQNFSDLVESRIGDREAAYTALSTRVSGWGALAFACGLPAMLVMLRRDAAYRRLAIGFAIGAASVLLLVQHDDWYARFVLFFPLVPVMAFAMMAAETPVLLLAGIPALLLQFVSTIVPGELPASAVAVLARQSWRDRSSAPIYGSWIAGADAVGYYADNYNDSYLLFRPDFSRRVVYARSMTADGLAGEFLHAGVTVVYAAPGTAARQRVFDQVVRQGTLQHLTGRFWTVVPPGNRQ